MDVGQAKLKRSKRGSVQAAKNIENDEENDAETVHASSLAEPRLPKRPLEVPPAQTNQVIDLTMPLTEEQLAIVVANNSSIQMKTVRAYSGDRYFEFVWSNGTKRRPDEFVKTMRETGFVLANPVQDAATFEQEMLKKTVNMCGTAAEDYDKQALVRMLHLIYTDDDVQSKRSELPSIRMKSGISAAKSWE